MTGALASPCMGYCKLNDEQVCAGCYRHIDEITGWRDKSETEKRHIVQRCAERKQACHQ